ncbi:MAG: crossover junction endodeoxyribonuclease RuvC [Desulfatiglans sp.]|jgi:crossover junction endodeoxyribonuclease RuvC|nr:crossover junction endodeoxyribonuclease RuvC [Thermodesulfobacteriota bacterium]MEE4352971.1 crossover junction endodeoxyribonuclease RuvC [Desulfatiglans sp.]
MLVVGVDPGSRVTGYGLVEKSRSRMVCVHCGKISPPAKAPFYERIHHIFESMVDIMSLYQPGEMAIEDVFYAKNFQSSLKLGHARGAALIAAVQCKVPIFEYTPLEIKKSIVGYGRANKEQVRSMVRAILNLQSNLGLDTSDALATAICHLNWSRFEGSQPSEK